MCHVLLIVHQSFHSSQYHIQTLEVNDFRHHLAEASIQDTNPHRYIASFVAIRLGLCDALVDAIILYSITYAVVAGVTWGSADPNSVMVLWGISAMVSACVLAVCGLKIPFWVSRYLMCIYVHLCA